MRHLLAAFLGIALCTSTFARADDPAPKSGTYTLTFTEPSPLTSKAELAKRFDKQDIPTYDLPSEPFLIHVPDDYTPARPHGLLIFLNYKDSTDLPKDFPALLAKHHLIYAMDTHHDHPDPAVAAIAADAVHNLSQTYTIDPKRVYVVGVQGVLTTAIAYSDVFTGALAWSNLGFYRPITDPKTRGTYAPQLPRLAGPTLGQAKTRPLILATRPDVGENIADYQALVIKAFRADGFRSLKTASYGVEDFHYPNLSTQWLEDAITFFESAPAPATRPALAATARNAPRKPATRPALSEPQRILSVAKFMIQNKSYPPARERLEQLTKDYPDDPAADEAKALLESINRIAPPTLEWKNAQTKPRSRG